MKQRDYNIDFLRGVATLWIIVVHTAFWSGELYLPKWFSNLTLLLDVPAFMYIAGLSFSYSNSITKTLKNIINQWKKWCYFLIFYVILTFIFYRYDFHFKDIISWLFYTFPKSYGFLVVGGSIWFISMYIGVSIFSSLIICINNYFEKNKDKNIQNLIYILLFLLLIFGHNTTGDASLLINKDISFYSLIFIFGYLTRNYSINLKQAIIYLTSCLIILIGILMVNDYNISYFQQLKFPPSIAYLFISSFSIIIFWYLKDKLKIKKNNILNYVGKNAIFYYFAQGMSSTLIYRAVVALLPTVNPYILFVLMVILNIALATALVVILEKLYNLVCKIKLDKFKKILLPTQK